MSADSTRPEPLGHFLAGQAAFGSLVHRVRPEQWGAATPCAQWDVRALVNHLVGEQRWVPELMAGRTVAEVGEALDGDLLGSDPVAAWDAAAKQARSAFGAAGALRRTVHLSYGDTPAERYCGEMALDAAVHGWDLARGIGAPDPLTPGTVGWLLGVVEPWGEALAGSGLFGTPVPVADDADDETRLLALLGRRSDWVAPAG